MIKRPVLIITISYILGILLGLYLQINIVPFIFFIVVILGIIVCSVITYSFLRISSGEYPKSMSLNILFSKLMCSNLDGNYINKYSFQGVIYKCVQEKKIIAISILVMLISFFVVNFKEYTYNTLYCDVGKDSEYMGTVISVKEDSEYYYNYVIKISTIKNNSRCSGTKILLQIKKDKKADVRKLEYGDVIVGIGDFEKPTVRRNYGGYDYSQYLKSKKIYMLCKSEYSKVQVLGKNSLNLLSMWTNALNNRLKSNLYEILPSELASVAVAFLLGDTSSLESNQKVIFSNAGLSHILAISGMHITYLVIGCSIMLRKFDNRKSKYLIIAFLIFFAFLTGGSTSVVRAVIMCSIRLTSKLVYRKSDSINNISLACLALLIFNPYIVLNLDFQLSFIGTLGIIILSPRLMAILDSRVNVCFRHEMLNILVHKIISITIISISVNICIFPIILYRLNTISIIFIISNLLVSPILGIMSGTGYITLLFSLISVRLASNVLFPFKVCLSILCRISEFSSNIVFLRYTVITPNLFWVILYYCIVVYLLFFYNKSHIKKLMQIAILMCIVTVTLRSLQLYNIGFKLYFVDVGQGDCSVIVTHNNTRIVIDGGGNENGDYDLGENVLVPYLLDRGMYTIDYIIISHFDSDHCKGLFTVMEKLKVKNAVISMQGEYSENYEYFLNLASNKNINIIYVKGGDRIKFDEVTHMDFFWPMEDFVHENMLNNNSIVCKFSYKEISVLFTGDIEKITEKRIGSEYGDTKKLNASILKVAHHGSKTSSTKEFLELVEPEIALVGVGENNKFGHPSNYVIERLENLRC